MTTDQYSSLQCARIGLKQGLRDKIVSVIIFAQNQAKSTFME